MHVTVSLCRPGVRQRNENHFRFQTTYSYVQYLESLMPWFTLCVYTGTHALPFGRYVHVESRDETLISPCCITVAISPLYFDLHERHTSEGVTN